MPSPPPASWCSPATYRLGSKLDGLPYSQACENNKACILEVLERRFADAIEVLEIGAGTGQHAVHFAAAMSWLRWQPSDLAVNLPTLRPRCELYGGGNLLPPLALDVSARPWPVRPLPAALFSANSLHIMPWTSVVAFFAELGERAVAGTLLAVYGPFNYGGSYTSDSNARFDQWLAARDPHSAIRDFEAVDSLAAGAGFALMEDHAMPANNRLLLWRRQHAPAADS